MSVTVTSAQRSYYSMIHKGKSEIELQGKIFELQQQMVMLPTTASNNSIFNELAAECQVCIELLDRMRQAEKSRIDRANNWIEDQNAGTDKYLGNLLAAISPNGQLIAAILEEVGGLALQEIQNWCEELESLDDQAFLDLLTELEKEEIIIKKDDRYYLNQLCEAGLKPVFGIGEKWKWSNFTPQERLVLYGVGEYNTLMAVFTSDVDYYSKNPEHHIKNMIDSCIGHEDYIMEKLELEEFPELPSETEISSILNRLVYKKYLVRENGIFCLPTLGKKV